MSAPIPARLRKVVKIAKKAGWTYDLTKRCHPRLSPPRGLRDSEGNLVAPVTFAGSPSDIRSDRNACASLRRAGVDVGRAP